MPHIGAHYNTHLPNAEKFDKKVAGEAGSKHLRDNEDVRSKSRLQHDGHVRCVEQLDRV